MRKPTRRLWAVIWTVIIFVVVTFPVWLAQVWTLVSDRPFAEDMGRKGLGWLVITPYYGWFCFAVGLVLVAIAGLVLLTEPKVVLPPPPPLPPIDEGKPLSSSNARREVERAETEYRFREVVRPSSDPASPDPKSEARIFVSEPIESILKADPTATNVQLIRSKSVYVGKWVRVTGEIRSVIGNSYSYHVGLIGLDATFIFNPSWADHLDHLKTGQSITIIGRMSEFGQVMTLVCRDCEVEYPNGQTI